MRYGEPEATKWPAGVAFENRSGVAVRGHEHRKRRKARRMAAVVAFSNSL